MNDARRQELNDRIRASSRDEVLLEEMIRLGFWPEGEGQPTPAAEIIRERAEKQRELQALFRENALWEDPERALKELHKQRKREAKERRLETRRRNAQARLDRARAWAERRKSDVLYLGAGVSAGLSNKDTARPLATGLPPLADAAALADSMGAPLAELRFLTFSRAVSTVSHYKRFRIPKKTGGERVISAPMPRLKRAQYWVLDNILAGVELHEAAHGFVPARSILSNARRHVGRDVVINLDLENFFPTLDFKRVKGMFESLGYCEAVATPLALLTTEPETDVVELDGRKLFVAGGPRLLPQGAPTSPAITNIICRRLDRRLSGLAATLGFTYSRYADDLTFSCSGEAARKAGTLLKAVATIVEAEGFRIHPKKTRVMRRGTRQEVTGLTVNDGVSVPRDLQRRFRAVLHQVEQNGPEGKRFGPGKNVIRSLLGFAHFMTMVDPESGAPLVARARRLAQRHGGETTRREASRALDFRRASAAGRPPANWRWTPVERTAPSPDLELISLDTAEKLKAEKVAAKPASRRGGATPSPAGGSVPYTGFNTAAWRTRQAERPAPTPPPSPSRLSRNLTTAGYMLGGVIGTFLLGKPDLAPLVLFLIYLWRRRK